MPNKPILITGCQRSGTTLMHLILDSHPDIHGIDEIDFQRERVSTYLTDDAYSPSVSWKLPRVSHATDFIREVPGIRVTWCIRDPRDVIASMINLQMHVGDGSVASWAVHPGGGLQEVRYILHRLTGGPILETRPQRRIFNRMMARPPSERSREEALFVGCLVWNLKHRLPELYDREGIRYSLLRYESLLAEPKQELQRLLEFLDLPWSDAMLEHHRLHSGVSIGNTINDRPIDASNSGKWKKEFSEDELAYIREQCGDAAVRYGYEI